MRLHLQEWGDRSAPPLVCVHGITSHSGSFRRLAEERLAGRFHVLAPDLRGHGLSDYEPPWSIEQHLEDLLETLPRDRAVWLGHSFGGRLVLELALSRPELVERAILLDPAIQLLPHVGLDMAEESRKERSYASLEEAVESRPIESRLVRTPRDLLEHELQEHLVTGRDGRLRYRYSQSAVVTSYSELARDVPSLDLLTVPLLLVVAAESWIVLDEQVERLRSGLGERLEVVTVPGSHIVLWEAFAETADAVERFVAQS